MSASQPVPDTEAQQILAGIARIESKLNDHATAINTVGGLVQWVVDNVKDIFSMFGNPQTMSMMQGMMGGMVPPVPADLTGEISEPADSAPSEPTGASPAADDGTEHQSGHF